MFVSAARPGLKHSRQIMLEPWQQEIIDEYPRYFFSNESTGILRLCGEALDRLGIVWRYSRPNVISVARREEVAAGDEHVGPKYRTRRQY